MKHRVIIYWFFNFFAIKLKNEYIELFDISSKTLKMSNLYNLIGKCVTRTKPLRYDEHQDYSFMNNTRKIHDVSPHGHIILESQFFRNESFLILDPRWDDDNWKQIKCPDV